jgi:hypothetical protein
MIWPVRAGPVAWLPIGLVIYFAGLHTLMHSISRYNLLAMPVVCGAAAVGLFWLTDPDRPGWGLRCVRVAAAIAAVAFGIHILRPATWMIIPVVSMGVGRLLFWLSGIALIVAAVWWITRMPREKPDFRRRIGFTMATVLGIVFLAQSLPAEGYSEWSVKLDDPDKKAQRLIHFPPELEIEEVTHAFVVLDLVSETGRNCDVRLEVDHLGTLVAIDSLVDSVSFYGKPSYMPFLDAYGFRRCDVRSWARYRLPVATLRENLADHQMEITLSGEPTGPNPGGIYLFGGLPEPGSRVWAGPGFTHAAVERLYEGRDPRLWESFRLSSTESASTLVLGSERQRDNLSDSWGRQRGQYRMLVSILMPDGKWYYF